MTKIIIQNLINKYERIPIIRGLVQLIPMGIGSAVEVALLSYVEKIKADRAEVFFDQLANGQVELTEEIIKSEDFLHCYFTTVNAALNTSRREKILFFANMLLSSVESSKVSNTDDYEEYLKILDELTFRELMILETLYNFEITNPFLSPEENDLQRATRFWYSFNDELISNLRIPQEEIDAVLTRLNRTGCYETFTGTYLDYTGGKGKTTATFKKLRELIKLAEQ